MTMKITATPLQRAKRDGAERDVLKAALDWHTAIVNVGSDRLVPNEQAHLFAMARELARHPEPPTMTTEEQIAHAAAKAWEDAAKVCESVEPPADWTEQAWVSGWRNGRSECAARLRASLSQKPSTGEPK